jgi:acyl-CoA synthetase (AMP-forming)/AMP-acid ligase II
LTAPTPFIARLVAETPAASGLSLVRATPLAQEPGIGALTIGGYLREVAGRFGPAEAVVFNSPNARVSWSYDELLRQSMAVAKALIATGTAPGARIGLLMTNRPEFLSSFFGIALAGGVAVTLSTFSTDEELAHLLAVSGIDGLLFERQVLKKDFAAMLLRLGDKALGALRFTANVGGDADPADRAPFEDWMQFLARGVGVDDAVVIARAQAVAPEDEGGIFFSSGTTSLPKGIIHNQQAFAIQWWRWPRLFGMDQPVRAWTGNGFFWSGNISMVVGTALSTGGAIVLSRFFDAAEALRVIAAERVTFANGRPHQWARLVADPAWETADLSSLRCVPRGELIWDHPTVETDWEVPQAFGTTETMSICTAIGHQAKPEDYAGSFGVPLPGNVLKIVDPATREILPLGATGEMCIKGPTLMRGYLGKTRAECFDPEGFYCTGDGGHVDAAGRFFWEGRLTAMIKTGGANVAPEEIDELVANWPGVKRCQTVGVSDALLGEKVVTCIVPVEGATIDLAALQAMLADRLASFKVPREFLLCAEADFALTGNEKIKPADIRRMAETRLNGAGVQGGTA